MIERHVTFHVFPDRGIEFSRFFIEEYRPAMARTNGFVKAELLRDMNAPQNYMMLLRFESLESAASWKESSEHQALKPKLKSLYQGSELKVFEILVEE